MKIVLNRADRVPRRWPRQACGVCAFVALGFAAACGDDSAGADDGVSTTSTTTSADTDTAGTTDSAETATGDSGSDTGGADKPDLGETANPQCEAVVAAFATIVDQNQQPAPDPLVIEEAYLGPEGTGAPLQDFVRTYGALVGRVDQGVLLDDKAILDALVDGSPAALIDVQNHVRLVMTLGVRERIAAVADAQPDQDRPPELLYAQWDDGFCYWNAALRADAVAADAAGLELESIEADIQGGFEWGHGGIEGPDVAWALDEWAVPSAKQVVEKSLFRAAHRILIARAELARDTSDALEARHALGQLRVVEDRLAGRNTPGIAIIEAQLLGDPALIDVDDLERQLDIAFAKRTRKYTSHALDEQTTGLAAGFKGAWEGRTYAKVALPDMEAKLDSFDGIGYLATWDQWIAAIEADDVPAATAASETLTTAICDYQDVLGIAACTSSEDETP